MPLQKILSSFGIVALLFGCATPQKGALPVVRPFAPGERVSFFGDSITHNGNYVAYLQLMQALRYPGSSVCLMNCGISGDSLGGGLGRLDWDLAAQHPTRVFVMFGMNDVQRNAYAQDIPDAKNREWRVQALETYAANQAKLTGALKKHGYEEALMTPTPFDEYADASVLKAPRCRECNEFGLSACAEIARREAQTNQLPVVELHAPLTSIMKNHPERVFCSDRVHPGPSGHALMAALLLDAMPEFGNTARVVFDEGEGVEACHAAVGKVCRQDGVLSFDYTPEALPLPRIAVFDEAAAYFPIYERFSSEKLVVKNLPAGRYDVTCDDVRVASFTAAELAEGIELGAFYTANQVLARQAAGWADALRSLWSKKRDVAAIERQVRYFKANPKDFAAADKALDAWLERTKDQKSHPYWTQTVARYRDYRARLPAFDAEEAALRDKLNLLRPRTVRMTVSPAWDRPVAK